MSQNGNLLNLLPWQNERSGRTDYPMSHIRTYLESPLGPLQSVLNNYIIIFNGFDSKNASKFKLVSSAWVQYMYLVAELVRLI